jgi:spermidine/putrescine transport system substrate-binding protein
MQDKDSVASTERKVLTRRSALKTLAVAATGVLAAPYIVTSARAATQLRALMWQPYVLPDVVAAFEEKHGTKFMPTFFDGNSEAYNKMRVGGTQDFDLVQADGFWPSLYFREKLIRSFDYESMPAARNAFPVFRPDRYKLLTDEKTGEHFGVPFCWGGYGISYNKTQVPAEKATSINIMFDPDFAGRLSTSGRFEENIALTALLVTQEMGTRDKPRPDGKPFNPYVLWDNELDAIAAKLSSQKQLLLTRYQDNTTLQNLMQSGTVTVATEFAQVYRQLEEAHRKGDVADSFAHTLRPKEGALGWVDTWLVSSGVTDDRLALCTDFINAMTTPEVMLRIAKTAGTSTTIDIRSLVTPMERELFLMDRTEELSGMYMFDQPSSPEKWEQVWSKVGAA